MRIAFIAMSGVRAHNPELTRLGLTLPGFVERNRQIASLPSLSLLTLAALTPSYHEVVYHEVAEFKDETALPEGYDLVAISSFSAQIEEAYRVADRYRQRGVPVVMGGLHVTALPDEALAHADAVVVGEGEPLWPRLLADFEQGALQRLYKTDAEFNLADAPIPRFDLLDPATYNRIPVQTSRGCPHRCSFCAGSVLLTRKYKVKPVEKVVAEIEAIRQIWTRPFIEFADDNSFVPHRHYRALMRALQPLDIRWFTETDLSVADDEVLLDLMREAGCRQVLIGLESPRRASLAGLELRRDWKHLRRDRYIEAIARIQRHGITVNGCFILGLDGDTLDIFDEVIAFVREAGLYEVQVTVATAFPGTPLYESARAEGRLLRERAWHLCTLFDVNLRPRHMSVSELEAGFVRLVEVLYAEDETRRRRRRFHRPQKQMGREYKQGRMIA